jgi:hypothetical protein
MSDSRLSHSCLALSGLSRGCFASRVSDVRRHTDCLAMCLAMFRGCHAVCRGCLTLSRERHTHSFTNLTAVSRAVSHSCLCLASVTQAVLPSLAAVSHCFRGCLAATSLHTLLRTCTAAVSRCIRPVFHTHSDSQMLLHMFRACFGVCTVFHTTVHSHSLETVEIETDHKISTSFPTTFRN